MNSPVSGAPVDLPEGTVIYVDDGRTVEYPTDAVYINQPETVRLGQTLGPITGALTYSDDEWR